jgi:hypothetical protein
LTVATIGAVEGVAIAELVMRGKDPIENSSIYEGLEFATLTRLSVLKEISAVNARVCIT